MNRDRTIADVNEPATRRRDPDPAEPNRTSPAPELPVASPRSRQRFAYSARLDREWAALRRRPSALALARAWGDAVDHPRLASLLTDLDDLGDLLAATQRGVRGDDEVLRELARVARRDQLAGRVVLQRVLPALIAAGARWRRCDIAVDPAEMLVPAAWIAIRRFDTDRRSGPIAPTIVSDAIFAAYRQPLRRRFTAQRLAHERLHLIDRETHHTERIDAIAELAAVLDEAQRVGVPEADIELVRRLAQTGSSVAVAREFGISDRAVRYRRERAVERIRGAVLRVAG